MGEMKMVMVVYGLMGLGCNWRIFFKCLVIGMFNFIFGFVGELFFVFLLFNMKICCGECFNMVFG